MVLIVICFLRYKSAGFHPGSGQTGKAGRHVAVEAGAGFAPIGELEGILAGILGLVQIAAGQAHDIH